MSTQIHIPPLNHSLVIAADWTFRLRNVPFNSAMFADLADAETRAEITRHTADLTKARTLLDRAERGHTVLSTREHAEHSTILRDAQTALSGMEADVTLPADTVVAMQWIQVDMADGERVHATFHVRETPLPRFRPFRADAVWQFALPVEIVNTLRIA